MRKGAAYKVAVGGVLGAAAVALLLLGGVFPFAAYCCPMLASLLLLPILELGGKRLALTWYAGVAILALLLCADKETALVFAFLGYYPVLREPINRLPGLWRAAVKLLLFNAAIAAMYALLLVVFRLPALTEEFRTAGTLMLCVMLAVGNLAFFLFDLLLKRATLLYRSRHK